MSQINKKFKKLIRDPKLFFTDMYKKRKMQISKYYPVKKKGFQQYTVVSAVYNVEKYLDEYFSSLTKQRLKFKDHIQLILVDDGSTDNSAKIIKKWQRKYPNNIQYIYKENGGQASARNLGLKHVKTEWVTFTDPDDYVNPEYFQSIDNRLASNPNLVMLVTNMIFFLENQKMVKDSHPLKFRFNSNSDIRVSNLNKCINLSAASTFFRSSIINKNNIYFDNKVKPNFEDGKFIADYLLDLQDSYASFNKSSIYFYRKREDNSSTLDGSWKKVEKYSDVFEFGFIPMLKSYKDKLGFIPDAIQKTALYDMSWYIQYLLNSPEKINFLDNFSKNKFYKFMNEVFSFIENKNIMEFNLAGTWMFHKVGVLGAFKNSEPPFQIAYIENIDRERKEILISYFTYFDTTFSIQTNGNKEIIPSHLKTVKNTLNNELFVYEKRLWVPYGDIDVNNKIKLILNKRNVRFSVRNNNFSDGISPKEIEKVFTYSKQYIDDGSWLFMDRETKADDNAEHLYRYMMKNHPERVCYFALNRSSSDWARLSKEGFNLVEFGTDNFKNKLRKASKIISSHLEAHINNHFADLYEFSKKFIFLQHGVTKDDLSRWVNTKKNLHCFVTATLPEYSSIVEDMNRYKVTDKEVVLTGFPRYDSLLSKNNKNSKQILIMPTWRSNIVGDSIGIGANTRSINKDFMNTEYAKHWYSVLHSKELERIANQYGYEIVFAPHSNIEPYLDLFNIPKYIKSWDSIDIQKLLGKSSILITDYSSIAFDMAYLNKSIIYYQFDKESFFSGEHTYQKGYFSYENDGFGPVTMTEKELFVNLFSIIKNKGKPHSKYIDRIRSTFPHQDQENCKRVYQSIINLDKASNNRKKLNFAIMDNMLSQAEESNQWNLVESRAFAMLKDGDLTQKSRSYYDVKYINALFMENKIFKVLEYLDKNKLDHSISSYWKEKINMHIYCNEKSIAFFSENNNHLITNEDLIIALLLSSYYQYKSSYRKILDNLKRKELSNQYKEFILLAKLIWSGDHKSSLEKINSILDNVDYPKYLIKLELFASYLSMDIFKLDLAHQYLIRYEKHTLNDPLCRIAIARLAQKRNNSKKLVDQVNKAFGEYIELLPDDLYVSYLSELDDTEKSAYLLDKWLQVSPDNMKLNELRISILFNENKWNEIIRTVKYNEQFNENIAYMYISSLLKSGKHKEANSLINSRANKENYFYWKLAAEAAEKDRDFKTLKICLENQLKLTDSLK